MALSVWSGADAASRTDALTIAAARSATTAILLSPPVLDGQRTVAEQAMAVAIAHDLTEPPELADYVVDLLDADALLDKPTWHFSRGEQQVAGLILTFARPFERLVLIDPTAGLDPPKARAFAAFLSDLALDVDIDIVSDADVFG